MTTTEKKTPTTNSVDTNSADVAPVAATPVASPAVTAPAVPVPVTALKTVRTVRTAKTAANVVAKPVAKRAAAAVKTPAKTAATTTVKTPTKTPAKPTAKPLLKPLLKPLAQAKTEKAAKLKKPKLVRDSFTIPKAEYTVLDDLKQRAGKLASSVKKSELIRAGVKALAAMSDAAFLAALKAVPTIKTGRPTKD